MTFYLEAHSELSEFSTLNVSLFKNDCMKDDLRKAESVHQEEMKKKDKLLRDKVEYFNEEILALKKSYGSLYAFYMYFELDNDYYNNKNNNRAVKTKHIMK